MDETQITETVGQCQDIVRLILEDPAHIYAYAGMLKDAAIRLERQTVNSPRPAPGSRTARERTRRYAV